MRHRDSKYELKEYIGLDEGFFETTDCRADKKDNETRQSRRGIIQASVSSGGIYTGGKQKRWHGFKSYSK